MEAEILSTVVDPIKQTVQAAEKEESKMYRIKSIIIGLILTVSTLFFGVDTFAQVGGVDVDISWIRQAGVGPLIDLPTVPVPSPNGQDGLARDACHYYYTTNGSGAQEYIFKINLAGILTGFVMYPGADFEALAYVINADNQGNDLLYGLDENGDQLVVFDPGTMTWTGVLIPILPGIGRQAIAGGYQHVSVQVDSGGYSIYVYDTVANVWGSSFPTPLGGTVLLDGLSVRGGGRHIGTEVVGGSSDLWRRLPGGPWVHIGGGYPTFGFRMSALGAF
jgi:hypothetical protein